MALTLVSPNGFRFFSVMIMISILIIALVNSIGNMLPEGMELLRFCIINLFGFVLYTYSVYRGKDIRNPKKIWYNNSFIEQVWLFRFQPLYSNRGKNAVMRL